MRLNELVTLLQSMQADVGGDVQVLGVNSVCEWRDLMAVEVVHDGHPGGVAVYLEFDGDVE